MNMYSYNHTRCVIQTFLCFIRFFSNVLANTVCQKCSPSINLSHFVLTALTLLELALCAGIGYLLLPTGFILHPLEETITHIVLLVPPLFTVGYLLQLVHFDILFHSCSYFVLTLFALLLCTNILLL